MPDSKPNNSEPSFVDHVGAIVENFMALANAASPRSTDQQLRNRIEELETDVTQLREALDAAEQTENYLRGALAKTRESAAATPKDLSDAVRGINDVVMLQLQFTAQAGSGAQRAVDIRRRQLAKYTPEHDRGHGREEIARYAVALTTSVCSQQDPRWLVEILNADSRNGTAERYLHAAALLMAAYDAHELQKEADGVGGNF